jgi:hypothetical protein
MVGPRHTCRHTTQTSGHATIVRVGPTPGQSAAEPCDVTDRRVATMVDLHLRQTVVRHRPLLCDHPRGLGRRRSRHRFLLVHFLEDRFGQRSLAWSDKRDLGCPGSALSARFGRWSCSPFPLPSICIGKKSIEPRELPVRQVATRRRKTRPTDHTADPGVTRRD